MYELNWYQAQAYAVLRDASTPLTSDEVAESAGIGKSTARKYLLWFRKIGVASEVKTAPLRYRFNPVNAAYVAELETVLAVYREAGKGIAS